jgi:hypothetical protein
MTRGNCTARFTNWSARIGLSLRPASSTGSTTTSSCPNQTSRRPGTGTRANLWAPGRQPVLATRTPTSGNASSVEESDCSRAMRGLPRPLVSSVRAPLWGHLGAGPAGGPDLVVSLGTT